MPISTENVLDGATGAYSIAAALAKDLVEYELAVEDALLELGLVAVGFEDVERFDSRARRRRMGEEMRYLASMAKTSEHVHFGSFYTFRSEDESFKN